LQDYIKERFVEIFDNKTLDSYRVRVNNTFTLLLEAIEDIKARLENRIKSFTTVQSCLEELVHSIETDKCLKYTVYSREKLIKILTDFIKEQKGKEDFSRYSFILFLIERIAKDNEKNYLPFLFEKVTDILNDTSDLTDDNFEDTVHTLDDLILNIGSHLISIGYSKIHLYSTAKELAQSSHFIEDFKKFSESCLLESKRDFMVVLKINIPIKILNKGEIPGLVKEIENKDILQDLSKYSYLQSFIKKFDNSRFYISTIQALDDFSAMKEAADRLATILDQLNLGLSNMKASAVHQGLALFKNEDGHYSHKFGRYYRTDGRYYNDIKKVISLQNYLSRIQRRKDINKDVKDRLQSAFRHLRIANYSMEIEEKFLNYWIAIEFLFSSPLSTEKTFERLRDNLSTILYCCYGKRNLEYLNDSLHKSGTLPDDENFWEKDDLTSLINRQTSLLLKYRIIRMKRHFLDDNQERRKYLDRHFTTVNQHITRIYRLRNELVHEAALKQDIENVTSNLQYYLIFVLNQMIDYFGKDEPTGKTMDDFFNEYKIIRIKLKEEDNLTVKDLLDVPFNHILIG